MKWIALGLAGLAIALAAVGTAPAQAASLSTARAAKANEKYVEQLCAGFSNCYDYESGPCEKVSRKVVYCFGALYFDNSSGSDTRCQFQNKWFVKGKSRRLYREAQGGVSCQPI